MESIHDLLDKYGVTLLNAPSELETNAWYVPKYKIIYVKEGLNEMDERNTILHELNGHVGNEHATTPFEAPTSRIHKEGEADRTMLRILVDDYIKSFVTRPSFVDVAMFLKVNNLRSDLYDMACAEFNDLLQK